MAENENFPKMIRIKQRFNAQRVDDVPGEVRRQLEGLNLAGKVRAEQSVAITVGSRGIANIAQITKAIVNHFFQLGARPFIVPAMGSHGGGTAEGQRAIVEGYGVTEEFLGVEIRSSMETVVVDTTPQGIPVHFDRNAWEADHVVVAGRVKPHTGFVGEIESGLHKMMLIGLGKHNGAKIYHRAIQDYSFPEIVRAVGDSVLKKCGVVCGVAIVENAYDETALIEAVPPQSFFEREVELLKTARAWMPRLPFRECDLLIIDEIGKNISGTGLDTNVVGRKYNDHAATDRDDTRCRRIFVRSLTPATHGNATGIGMAEFINRATADAIDHRTTQINAITGGHPTAAMTPIVCDTDRDAVAMALQTVGLVEPPDARVMQITNTLHVAELLVSEAYAPQLREWEDLETVTDAEPMAFDASGSLAPVQRAEAGQHG
ncbi:MAG: DUF2088 domain-containing protein [Planctomycetota bacterium]|nr:MAG: DUF2088 domain-containing protein [Planctomycetota bacterium]REJ98487.1 MAG: DUF2088 domain-containing protein [Planctomycetota bacterium]REK23599.1 MAG: DUF2088 domain-containing protein [Planctomycetota bacterium]REK31176.1 MAG: DUF2088 domain-containing protein [Planctomycetota bacterium]